MNAADACFLRIVKLRIVIPVLAQLLHALRCSRAQIIEPAEHDRFGRTNLRARGHEAAFLAIVTESAFECAAGVRQRLRAAIYDTKRARHDAVAATVANIVLHKDRVDFGAHDRASGTSFEATGFLAMLANIGEKNPAKRVFFVTIA